MPEYLAPGVFVEEIDSGSKPIEGVGTSTAAFVGYAKSGEFNKPIAISSWMDFQRWFGEEENRILHGLADETGRKVTALLEAKRKSGKNLVEFASRELLQLNGHSKSWTQFCVDHKIDEASPFMNESYLAYAVKGFFDNGGGRAFVVRVPRKEDIEAITYIPESAMTAKPATLALPGVTIKALEAGSGGNDITVEVTHVAEPPDGFTMKISKGASKSENFGSKSSPLTPGNLTGSLKESKLVDFVITEVMERPEMKTFTLEGGSTSAELPAVPLDREIASAIANDIEGKEGKRSGLYALDLVDEMLMICVPDLMVGMFKKVDLGGLPGPEEPVVDPEIRQAILNAQKMVISYCERRADSVAILDPLPGLEPFDMQTIVSANLSADKGHATVYYPWVKVPDQIASRTGKREAKFVPPCGHIAGVWARTDIKRGVHKAPANEPMLGVLDLERQITKGDQERLNPNGINCIRAFPGMGIRVWGARTLATNVNQSWKYLNVRRLFDYLEKSIEKNMMWAVFEPNDEDLWGRLRRNISAFLYTEWKEGKLFGIVPEEAFYVKCDRELNTTEMIDLGRVYVEIGVNPVKPAEFVIFRIGQWTGGASISES